MGRSKESLKRKRSPQSKRFDDYAKRRTATRRPLCNISNNEENTTQSTSTDCSTGDRSFCDVATYKRIPYASWTIYFFNQEYNEHSLTVSKIEALMEFFERNTCQSLVIDVEAGFNFDINLCSTDLILSEKWPTIIEDMNVNPRHTFNCIRAAYFEVMFRRSGGYESDTITEVFKSLRLNGINIINHESINALPHLELRSYGKLVSIRGIVIGITFEKPSSGFVALACKCNREIIVTREHEKYSLPRNCKVCGNGKFKRLLDSPYEFTKVEQTIQMKDYRPTDEIIDDSAISPNIVTVKLEGSLVNKFMLGDKVRVIGIPRIKVDAVKSRTSDLCPLYVDGISIFAADASDEPSDDIAIDRNIIERIKSEPDALSLLVKSLCPAVQGHEIIKAALILGMFGGSFESGETRDYVHTLIIGNLGLGKSQLLRACAQVAPKGLFVPGSSTKSLEPTITNIRENDIEYSRLENGAFTLATDGICFIDELDKIPAQHQSIYACMEYGRVNIRNSDMKLELEARTAIVGMINPKKKFYDSSKTVAENVNASREFISRFDMIFVMRDRQDTYRDKLMCDRVLDVHRTRRHLTERTQFSDGTITREQPRAGPSPTLTERLIIPNESSFDILSQNIFQMYINYARKYVKPEISRGPKAAIEQFCLHSYRTQKELPSIERLVRLLINLSQAFAKIDLRAKVSEADVYDSIEILKHTSSFWTKDRAVNRPLASSSNSNKLTANKVKQFLNELQTEARILGKNTFATDELRAVAGKENFTEHSLSTLLSKLNEQGYLLKVSSDTYKLISN